MPKTISNDPEALRPYLFHGLNLNWREGDKHAIGQCPWCGREDKLNIVIANGVWRCVVCGQGNKNEGGNARIFVRMLLEKSLEQTEQKEYGKLANERKLLYADSLKHWKLAKSILTDEWLLPGYGIKGTVSTLYKYVENAQRRLWLPTPTLGHQLFGMNLFDGKKPTVYLCEGLWDAIALWEVMRARSASGSYLQTANPDAGLLADASVLAIPTCSVFNEHWAPLFANKQLVLMAQNDHPRAVIGGNKVSPPASYHGMRRVTNILSEMQNPPLEIKILSWGQEGFTMEYPSGYDVRDALNVKGGK